MSIVGASKKKTKPQTICQSKLPYILCVCKYHVFVNCQLLQSSCSFKTNWIVCLHGFNKEGEKRPPPSYKSLKSSLAVCCILLHLINYFDEKFSFPTRGTVICCLNAQAFVPAALQVLWEEVSFPLVGTSCVGTSTCFWQKSSLCFDRRGLWALCSSQHQQPAWHICGTYAVKGLQRDVQVWKELWEMQIFSSESWSFFFFPP